MQRQLGSRTVRAGEEEPFKARAKELGRVKLIDLITARLDAKNDCFVPELPSLRLKEVRIDDALVHTHERMLTGGFYAKVDLSYDPSIAEVKNGRPFCSGFWPRPCAKNSRWVRGSAADSPGSRRSWRVPADPAAHTSNDDLDHRVPATSRAIISHRNTRDWARG